MTKEILGLGSETDQPIRRLEKQNRKPLKTLKDIECRFYFGNGIYSKDLRQVAREWIKKLDSACENLESDNDWIELMIRETSHRGDWGRDVIKRWIKHFFNLEETK